VPAPDEVQPLVQIYSRGFTGGMFGGRQGRGYITREQPDNRGVELGVVVGRDGGDLLVELSSPLAVGDGIAFEPPPGTAGTVTGFAVQAVRTIGTRGGVVRQAVRARDRVPAGWRVVRSSQAALLERARASYAALPAARRERRARLDVRVFGAGGAPLKAVFRSGDDEVTVRSELPLAPATKRALDVAQLREQLGRLGGTPFALAALDVAGLAPGLFLPVSELNRLRQAATDDLMLRRDWARQADLAERESRIAEAVARAAARVERPAALAAGATVPPPFELRASVYDLAHARAAAEAGATEIVLDPFLRHPMPPVARVRALHEELAARGVRLRLRTPTVVRPAERRTLEKWLALELPVLSGHLGLVSELGRAGRDVVADYAVNVFNQHTAAELFRLGAARVTTSVELTTDEIGQLVAPWDGEGFDVLVYGRPEGMTIEHCVLSAAFDRVPTTCRDLCVQKHANVQLTDPAGYTFAVATDSACRNRLLHSRPVEASEYLPRLWRAGVRGYQLVFNVPGDRLGKVVAGYRRALDALAGGGRPDLAAVRAAVDGAFTRGHFARAV
jgi:putative protease